MNAADKREFQALLTEALAFYRQNVSSFALTVWWQACEPFSLDQVSKAMTAHAMDPDRGKFAPMPADIVRHLRGTLSDRSLTAWGKVFDAIQRIGAYTSVVFDDPAIHCAISDMGGWPTVCRSKTEDLPFLQKRFCDLHRTYSAQPGRPYPARLIGVHEASNRLNGQPVDPPMLVGNPTAAALAEVNGTAGSKTAITVQSATVAQIEQAA